MTGSGGTNAWVAVRKGWHTHGSWNLSEFDISGSELRAILSLIEEHKLFGDKITLHRMGGSSRAKSTLVVGWWVEADGGGQRGREAVLHGGEVVAVSGPGIDDEE